jgi:hypothetical protein
VWGWCALACRTLCPCPRMQHHDLSYFWSAVCLYRISLSGQCKCFAGFSRLWCAVLCCAADDSMLTAGLRVPLRCCLRREERGVLPPPLLPPPPPSPSSSPPSPSSSPSAALRRGGLVVRPLVSSAAQRARCIAFCVRSVPSLRTHAWLRITITRLCAVCRCRQGL